MNSIPRNEYPRPQLVRSEWLNLNGEWGFEIDYAKSGEEKEFFTRESLNDKIIVPFCPESKLSGIGNTDFMECVWYRKNFEIPEKWNGKNIILHFGAVDYHAKVYVNGKKVGEHKGGYTGFSFDITEYIKETENYITLCAYDNNRSHNQPSGKQCPKLNSYFCSYTRITGIWQTVWLEAVDKCYIKSLKIDTNTQTPSVQILSVLSGNFLGCRIEATAFWEGKVVGSVLSDVISDNVFLEIQLSEKHLWEVGKGNLYDLKIEIKKDEQLYDSVESYFGLRSVSLSGRKFLLNGKSFFGRWVLDQGYYPDGLYTAPTDEDLKNDILYSMQLGFNGARLHEKMFEPRFLYWADKLGYTVWGEHANWELNITEAGQIQYFLPEWIEFIERDYNHPALIGWAPFNETWDFEGKKQCDELLRMVYKTTKALDKTRPVIDTSGNYHVETDIFDVHDYEQNTELFRQHYIGFTEYSHDDLDIRTPFNKYKNRHTYDRKLPVFVSEYGGIKWSEEEGWGYGETPKTKEEFIERYRKLTEVLLQNENLFGFCYTQLYDIEQEQNGLMTYERKFKFPPEIFYEINTQKAAIED